MIAPEPNVCYLHDRHETSSFGLDRTMFYLTGSLLLQENNLKRGAVILNAKHYKCPKCPENLFPPLTIPQFHTGPLQQHCRFPYDTLLLRWCRAGNQQLCSSVPGQPGGGGGSPCQYWRLHFDHYRSRRDKN